MVDAAPLPACARLPAQHLARAYHGIDAQAVPLLRLAHTPQSGAPPLVAWHRPLGRGTAVFYAGALAPAADDWMAVRGTAEALVRDLLQALPATLGRDPVEVAPQPGVYETRVADGVLGWNATDAPLPWRGADLAPGAIAHRVG